MIYGYNIKYLKYKKVPAQFLKMLFDVFMKPDTIYIITSGIVKLTL